MTPRPADAWRLTCAGRTVAVHGTRLACVVEAFERGWVGRIGSADFPEDEDLPDFVLDPRVRIDRVAVDPG